MKMSERHQAKIVGHPEYAAAAREIDFQQTIADLIVEARIRAGWTQHDLASHARLTQPQVSQLESGVGNQKLATVERAFAALRAVVEVDLGRVADCLTPETDALDMAIDLLTRDALGTSVSLVSGTVEQVNSNVPEHADVEAVETAANSNLALAA